MRYLHGRMYPTCWLGDIHEQKYSGSASPPACRLDKDMEPPEASVSTPSCFHDYATAQMLQCLSPKFPVPRPLRSGSQKLVDHGSTVCKMDIFTQPVDGRTRPSFPVCLTRGEALEPDALSSTMCECSAVQGWDIRPLGLPAMDKRRKRLS
jgi:hypothetical protein